MIVASLAAASKHYGKIQALKHVDLAVEQGEVLALLGPNGAGKTTAVSLMLGLIRPSSGQARLFEGDPQALSNRQRVGAMLQMSGVPQTLKVKEHIHLFSSYYPQPLKLTEVIAAAGLEGLEERFYGKLSGGQQQRLHLALAICGNPDLLFLDEPTTGLDVQSRRLLWEEVRAFLDLGKTVVLTTHYLEEADALADRVVVINQGVIVAEGSPASIKARSANKSIHCITRLSPAFIATLEHVTKVQRDGAGLDILVTKAEPVVYELLKRDPDLSDLEVTGAGLEQAFLALTQEPIKEVA